KRGYFRRSQYLAHLCICSLHSHFRFPHRNSFPVFSHLELSVQQQRAVDIDHNLVSQIWTKSADCDVHGIEPDRKTGERICPICIRFCFLRDARTCVCDRNRSPGYNRFTCIGDLARDLSTNSCTSPQKEPGSGEHSQNHKQIAKKASEYW